ncbi:hypothetical protein RFN28_00805 [Mesorhizobium sp. VK24D]|uniref:Uncharacterized protein n=1 Tax=Mesorhizobium album TaxID=3072314 RepID=A0ABU4XQJ4_9HYPH|nr:hypothetical protein [Mesorhizobium sp. VK24D]MDX8477010.1 hypothetical protein [Mesorhizobium sp. VK24D]
MTNENVVDLPSKREDGTEPENKPFRGVDPTRGFDDGRKAWDWSSKFPDDARKLIKREACIAAAYLGIFLLLTFVCAGLDGRKFTFYPLETVPFSIDIKLIAVFCTGALGGTTFSIKWLMHSVATGRWHLDRFYWRLFVPLVGGVYAVIVMNLAGAGLMAGAINTQSSVGALCAVAFLVGYFSDGVSGLLTNVANAVFGTVEKK